MPRAAGALLVALGLLACRGEPADPRPSILLVVIDTLRADAVSAYGEVTGTTPTLDGLAAEGLRYTRATAPSPWTLPSHATLLTGRDVAEHGVGTRGRMVLPPSLETLAEQLATEGYETVAFSENPLVGPHFGFDRGFQRFSVASVKQILLAARGQGADYDVVAEVRGWSARGASERPFFAFVNLFEPHDPYSVRAHNPFLPEGVEADEARRAHPPEGEPFPMCRYLPSARALAMLRGLYLGDVAAADARLAEIHARMRAVAGSRPLITLVTSDHGEHLGEHGLMGHEYSVRGSVLHVPLVVHGIPDLAPGVVTAPVSLADLAPSLRAWARGARAPDGGAGLPLTQGEGRPDRTLLSVFSDDALESPATMRGLEVSADAADRKRQGCVSADGVFGDTVALLRPPYKLIWFAQRPSQLFDLRWDPKERSDTAAHDPDRVRALEAEVERYRARLAEAGAAPAEVSPEAAEALRGLGYAE